jgi:hypothetical protein
MKTGTSFPGTLLPELYSAVVRMSQWIKTASFVTGGIYTLHQEYVDDSREKDRGDRARIDLEQVTGTNFRESSR